MPIEPPEVPPATPGTPKEPPPGIPPGNPRPEVPVPVREPGAPPRPDELPGKVPDEFPVRGPNGPNTPNPATDVRAEYSTNATGDNMEPDGTSDLKPPSECVMNRSIV